MKRMLSAVLLCVLGSASFGADIQQAVNHLIDQVDPNINMGIKVVDLTTHTTLFQRNANSLLVPASNMKLFSDAAALMALGPDYRFKTTLTTNASHLQNGLLKGNLYLHLPGDPSLTHMDLDVLFRELRQWGVRRIKGNVILVSAHDGVSTQAPGAMPQDLNFSYGASVAPVMVDENRLTVTVNPSHREGEPAIVEFDDGGGNIHLVNQIKTRENGSRCGVGLAMNSQNQLVASGCIGAREWALVQRIPIRNPRLYAEGVVRQRLAKAHIVLDGQVLPGSAPANTMVVATHASRPISQLMADTLKPSDNLYADSLFLHVAATLAGKPLNWASAEPVVKKFLEQQTGVSLQNAVITDGSGLSRNDRVSAAQTVGLLQFLYDHFPMSFEYIAALPIAGRDGTLQKRFRQPGQQGFLRAKTGTMTGIMSLSGYLYTANDHTLAFAIYINRRPGTPPAVSGRYRSLVDTVCNYFLRQQPGFPRMAGEASRRNRVAFETQPTQLERTRARVALWRRMESSLKASLKGQPITVVFRNNQIELRDNGASPAKVWSVLAGLRKKYPFAVVLQANTSPGVSSGSLQLLWIKTTPLTSGVKRTWIVNGVA